MAANASLGPVPSQPIAKARKRTQRLRLTSDQQQGGSHCTQFLTSKAVLNRMDISHAASPQHLRLFKLELAQPPYESADDDCAAAGEQQQV